MLNRLGKNVPCAFEIVARIEHPIDAQAVPGPPLDLVKVARVCKERVFWSLRPTNARSWGFTATTVEEQNENRGSTGQVR